MALSQHDRELLRPSKPPMPTTITLEEARRQWRHDYAVCLKYGTHARSFAEWIEVAGLHGCEVVD